MLHSKKSCFYRFNHELPAHLPLAVRSAGKYSLVPGSQIEPPRRKWFSEIFWSEEGCGEFNLGKQKVQVRDCEIFYLLPGELHDIRPVSRMWKYHWFTLDHGQSPQWLEAFGFIRRPLPAQHCPVKLFQSLRAALRKGTIQGDREAAHHAHGILLNAMEGSLAPFSRGHSSWVEQCRKLIDESYTHPDLNVASIAQEMGVHRATLFRAFLAAYGITPSSYLQNRRVHHAMKLLTQGNTPIKEVATRVGLSDSNYLARLLRKFSGMSPGKFRACYHLGRMGAA